MIFFVFQVPAENILTSGSVAFEPDFAQVSVYFLFEVFGKVFVKTLDNCKNRLLSKCGKKSCCSVKKLTLKKIMQGIADLEDEINNQYLRGRKIEFFDKKALYNNRQNYIKYTSVYKYIVFFKMGKKI